MKTGGVFVEPAQTSIVNICANEIKQQGQKRNPFFTSAGSHHRLACLPPWQHISDTTVHCQAAAADKPRVLNTRNTPRRN